MTVHTVGGVPPVDQSYIGLRDQLQGPRVWIYENTYRYRWYLEEVDNSFVVQIFVRNDVSDCISPFLDP